MDRDVYSNFKFFQAIPAQGLSDNDITGEDIDLQGYEGCAIVVNVGMMSEVTSASYVEFMLLHADVSTAGGAGTYADVSATDIIGLDPSVTSLTNGIWKHLAPLTTSNISTFGSENYGIGYRGTKRYVKLSINCVGAPCSAAAASDAGISAMALLGLPANWPVNEAVDVVQHIA